MLLEIKAWKHCKESMIAQFPTFFVLLCNYYLICRLFKEKMISGPKYCKDTTYVGERTFWEVYVCITPLAIVQDAYSMASSLNRNRSLVQKTLL